MGLLVDGIWHDKWYDTSKDGKFKRESAKFRDFISQDSIKFTPEKDRYHLYVSYACPWAHRTLIFRKLKNLENIISISVVNPYMAENGWTFEPGSEVIQDSLYYSNYLHQIYTKAKPDYSGRVTVPILWDKKLQTIVNNESADIIRIFNKSFNVLTGNTEDFYPSEFKSEIDKLNEFIYHNINNGVYKTGFATKQEVYEEALNNLFKALNEIETKLENNSFLVGSRLTEADIRLFTTLIRFDTVYYSHFKTNLKLIKDYRNIFKYLQNLYSIDALSSTTNMQHIKDHYFKSHKTINPTGIVPVGPEKYI